MGKSAHEPLGRNTSDPHRPSPLFSADTKGWGGGSVGHKPVSPQTEITDPEDLSLLWIIPPGLWFLARLCLHLSYLSWCDPFIPYCGGKCSTTFPFFFSKNCSMCNYRLGVSRGSDFRGFLCCHLGRSSFFLPSMEQFYWDMLHIPCNSAISAYNSLVFGIFTKLCQHHHNQF